MSREFKILIIDDEEKIKNLLQKILLLEGYDVITAENCRTGKSLAESDEVGLIISDVRLPDGSGIDITKEIKSKYSDKEIILLTAYGQIKDGVTAMKYGAFDYLVKGDDDDKIPLVIKKAYEKVQLNRQLSYYKHKLKEKYLFENIIGNSKQIKECIELAKKVASTDTPVLILGETGTGKELFAQSIHNASSRKDKKFIAVNCSAVPKDLQESEFFGHKKGAFTGAVSDRKGIFETANGGTLFLDEIGDMSAELQPKLLRVIETGTFSKIGDSESISSNVRIISATNKNIVLESGEDKFREDLLYRLNAFTIMIPPLRERKEDIPLFADEFLKKVSAKIGKPGIKYSPEFIEILKNRFWKGNVRELRNIIERAVILSETDTLTPDLIPDENPVSASNSAATELNKDSTLKEIENRHILKVYDETKRNKVLTSRILGIGKVTLYRKLKELGLE